VKVTVLLFDTLLKEEALHIATYWLPVDGFTDLRDTALFTELYQVRTGMLIQNCRKLVKLPTI
jgi:hypothetical protein